MINQIFLKAIPLLVPWLSSIYKINFRIKTTENHEDFFLSSDIYKLHSNIFNSTNVICSNGDMMYT